MVVKIFDAYRAEILNQNAKSSKVKGCCSWSYVFTYFHENVEQENTWSWYSLELEGLRVIVGSYSGRAEIDNGSSANLFSWVSDKSKS